MSNKGEITSDFKDSVEFVETVGSSETFNNSDHLGLSTGCYSTGSIKAKLIEPQQFIYIAIPWKNLGDSRKKIGNEWLDNTKFNKYNKKDFIFPRMSIYGNQPTEDIETIDRLKMENIKHLRILTTCGSWFDGSKIYEELSFNEKRHILKDKAVEQFNLESIPCKTCSTSIYYYSSEKNRLYEFDHRGSSDILLKSVKASYVSKLNLAWNPIKSSS